MKVLHVIDSAGVYGAEKVLLSLAGASASRGHEVFVGTIVAEHDVGDPLGESAVAQGLRHVRFQMRDGPNAGGLRRIVAFAREQAIDVIHSHGYKANILLACAPRREAPWALVCTLHGWTSGGRWRKLRLYEALERRLLRRFDHVVAVSSRIAEEVRRRVAPERLTTIANGVEVADVGSTEPVHYRCSVRAPRPVELLAVGRLSVEKGFDLLIGAVRRLRERGIDVHLKIVGEGPERGTLEARIAASSLAGSVELCGYQRNLRSFYRAADFFVLSSRTEGLPIVLLEAIAQGTPVVASAVGDVSAVLEGGRCGWLISRPEEDAIVEALIEALQSPPEVRLERSRQARERIGTAYSVTAMADRYLAVYLQSQEFSAHARHVRNRAYR